MRRNADDVAYVHSKASPIIIDARMYARQAGEARRRGQGQGKGKGKEGGKGGNSWEGLLDKGAAIGTMRVVMWESF